jgi:hypothetical protein
MTPELEEWRTQFQSIQQLTIDNETWKQRGFALAVFHRTGYPSATFRVMAGFRNLRELTIIKTGDLEMRVTIDLTEVEPQTSTKLS